MKKLAVVMMCAAILLSTTPLAVSATTSDTQVINKHGARTYIGDYSDWNNSSWDSDNFKDVTDEDVDCSDPLIIKGGKVGDVTVSDESDLTIYDGTMSHVQSDGSITMYGGTADSLDADDDISISGGVVKANVESDEGITLSGKLTVSGDITGKDVTVSATGGNYTTVSGDISFSENMLLQGTQYKLGKIDGQSSGMLEFKGYTGTLPTISNVQKILVDSNSIVTAGNSVSIGTLEVDENAVFTTASTITADTVVGPGTIIMNANQLTVNTGISQDPILDLNGTGTEGTTVLKAKSGTVSTGDVTIYGYTLTKDSTDTGYDSFILKTLAGEGITLGTSSVTVSSTQPATVKADVNPALTELPTGTKLYWKLIDTSSKFSIAQDPTNNTCKIYLSSSAGTASYHATLGAYLVDSSGDILANYKSASCSITSSANSTGSGITLDTKAVNIAVGHTYYVLAATDAKTPPVQLSYNSAVAAVGKAAAYHSNGKVGWLYPVKAVANGSVTIDIGGQKMYVTAP